MDRRLDLAGAVFFALFGAVGVVAAINLDALENLRDPLTARGMPLAVGLFILIVASGIALRQAVKLARGADRFAPTDGKADLPDHPSSFLRVVLIWAGAVAYAIAMPVTGYLVASFAGVCVLLWLMEMRDLKRIALIAAIYAVTTWAFFGQVLSVNLPTAF